MQIRRLNALDRLEAGMRETKQTWATRIAVAFTLVILLALGVAARCYPWDTVFSEGTVLYADGDCYARMTRARMVIAGGMQPVRAHDFENWPEGTRPHTTAPLDYAIVALAALIDAPVGGSDWEPGGLAYAGAWVAPLAGLLGLIGLAVVWPGHVRGRLLVVALAAVSPPVVWANVLGRPDHQAFLVPLLSIGAVIWVRLIYEERGAGWWAVITGLVWGVALWISLFEPTFFLLLGVIGWALRAGRRVRLGAVVCFFAGMAVPLATWLLLEDVNISLPGSDPAFARWALLIPELGHPGLREVAGWTGWASILALGGLFLRGLQRGDHHASKSSLGKTPAWHWFSLMVLVLLLGLALWQRRWAPYTAMAIILFLTVGLRAIADVVRWHIIAVWARIPVAVIFGVALVWPLLEAWDHTLYSKEAERRRTEQVEEARYLRAVGKWLKEAPAGDSQEGVLAPYWLAPALTWWSGLPNVGGVSHQSLPGIMATATFFAETDWQRAMPLLRERRVRWLVADTVETMESTSAILLGRAVEGETVAKALGSGAVSRLPATVQMAGDAGYFKWYEIRE